MTIIGSDTCSIPSCGRPVRTRGWCNRHYQRWLRLGDPKGERKLWDGNCVDCGATEVSKSSRRCRACTTQKARDWRARNPEESRALNRRQLRELRVRNRKKVLDHYGRSCACCGETEEIFLALDHVNEDGAAHRRSIDGKRKDGRGMGGSRMYAWVIRHGFPSWFQTLCHNCNWAKSHGGCPHQRQRATITEAITEVDPLS
jgi:hypothetical protein